MQIDELRAAVQQEEKVHFWGSDYTITPCLIDQKFGDGKQLICFQTLSFRPNYYVIQGDSKWELNNWELNGPDLWYDDVLDAISDQCGDVDDMRWDDETDEEYEARSFPMLDASCGATWGEFEL